MNSMNPPVNLFISYSHKDILLKDRLLSHIESLVKRGLIQPWHDRMISPGEEWAGEIDAHLEMADIILILVSADFINSHYCFDLEFNRSMERYNEGEANVIPIILRPCVWQKLPFGLLQALPINGKAMSEWSSLDAALTNITLGIEQSVNKIIASKANALITHNQSPISITNASKQTQTRSELKLSENMDEMRLELINAILKLPQIYDRNRRLLIISLLGNEKSINIQEQGVARDHVLCIVDYCLNAQNGLIILRNSLEFFYKNMIAFSNVLRIIEKMIATSE